MLIAPLSSPQLVCQTVSAKKWNFGALHEKVVESLCDLGCRSLLRNAIPGACNRFFNHANISGSIFIFLRYFVAAFSMLAFN